MKHFSITLIFMCMILLSACENKTISEVKIVSPEEMQTLLDMEDIQLVDVRTSQEYTKEKIPGAQNIDFNSPTFDDDISKLDKSKPVILYCQKGGRSAQCAAKLKEAGFIMIYDLEGGITKWKFSGRQVKGSS